MTDRPQPILILSRTDKALEILGWSALACLWGLGIYGYITLPDSIPTHFNALGQPDGYGKKGMIFLLPILGTFLFVGLSVLNLFPQQFNYWVTITEENAQQQYRIATRMLRFIKVVIVGLFLFIVSMTMSTALGKTEGLGIWFLPLVLGLVLIPTGIFMAQSIKNK